MPQVFPLQEEMLMTGAVWTVWTGCPSKRQIGTKNRGFCVARFRRLLETKMTINSPNEENVSINEMSSRCREGPSITAPCTIPSLQLMNLPPPWLHSSREPSCRKACGGYNELGVYLGVPRPLTHDIIHQGGPTLKRNGGPPKPGTLRPDPAGEAGAADFHLFLFVFIIPSCSSSLMCLEGIHGSVYNLFKKPREEKYWALSEKRTWRWMERNGAPFFFAHMEKISRPPLLL